MLYVRGQPLDYDTWSQLGNRGCSWESVLPYFRRSEHYEGTGDETRGKGGSLNVVEMYERHELLDAFIEAGEAEGWKRNTDYNNGDQEGFGYYQCTQKNGRRWSTAKAFLEPARNRPNLRVETNAQATGLLFEGKRCGGVADVQNGQPREARCGREVVLAAGAIQSPHILELSGIGQPERLQPRSEEHTSELQSLMRISYAVFCLKKKNTAPHTITPQQPSPLTTAVYNRTPRDRQRPAQTTNT